MISLLNVMPLVFTGIMCRYSELLDAPQIRKKYGTLYEGLRLEPLPEKKKDDKKVEGPESTRAQAKKAKVAAKIEKAFEAFKLARKGKKSEGQNLSKQAKKA